MNRDDPAPGWRRLVAFAIDYLLVIVPFLGVMGLLGWCLLSMDITLFHPSHPWSNQGIVLVFVTLPIGSYFAFSEASAKRATLGKRWMGVFVVHLSGRRLSLRAAFVRVALKFFPWECFHFLLWHWEGWPTNPVSPSRFQLVGMLLGWFVMGWFVLSLFLGSRRTPYDWVAGSWAVRRIEDDRGRTTG